MTSGGADEGSFAEDGAGDDGVDIDSADEDGTDGIDEDELRKRFGLLVVLFNVGPIAFFIGVFLVAFEGARQGYAVAAVGLLVTVAGLRIYRRTEAHIDADEG